MMRSLYSGVSGLKTHQVKMDVIGNNIANVNTVAYKSQSITFSELMYQTTQKASGPNAETGRAGVNAKQIGLGVTSAAISTNIKGQGSSQNTGNAFDLRISGDAFFVVNGGNGNKFTRDGSFYVDAAGNLAMSSNGFNVMGWQVDKNGDIVQDNVSKLQIMAPANLTSEPQVTSRANMSGIVDKNDPQVLGDGKVVNLSIYDNLGYAYTARFLVQSTDDDGTYALVLDDIKDSNNESIIKDVTDAKGNTTKAKYNGYIYTGSAVPAATDTTQINRTKTYGLSDKWTLVDNSGKIKNKNTGDELDPSTITDNDKKAQYAAAWGVSDWDTLTSLTFGDKANPTKFLDMVADATLRATVFDTTASSFKSIGFLAKSGSALTVTYDQISGALSKIGGSTLENFNLTINPRNETTGADDNSKDNPFSMNSAQGDDQGSPGIKVYMTDTSNVNNEKKSTIGALAGDSEGFGTGWAVGTMTGVSIDTSGKIYGAYDNGQTKLLGQIAFATFANAAGLEKEGDNLYSATLNSGEFDGIGVDVSADGGKVSSGILEMSNVDLSTEFTELITTQRGFQANSRIITVSDTLLEELVNLKR
jgi:flagellar hook protein FlgE